MSLHFWIDGYNLLHALPEFPAGTWETKRAFLLQKLTREKPYGHNQAQVIFDSRNGLGDHAVWKGLKIIFTASETADDWMIRMARQAPNIRNVVVVTDDKGIHRMVKGTGVRVMGCQEFLKAGQRNTLLVQPAAEAADLNEINDELKRQWKID